MLRSGLIAPYRGVRYHLKEYSNNSLRNSQELFNLRHASLRNAIERAFGVLKKRFPIIASANIPTYGIQTQKAIILACCILHNYLMSADPDDSLIDEVDHELNVGPTEQEYYAPRNENEDAARGEQLRDSIANDMWIDYRN